jgi:hypothetical protein
MLEENSTEKTMNSHGKILSDERNCFFTHLRIQVSAICNTYVLMHICTKRLSAAFKLKTFLKYYVNII